MGRVITEQSWLLFLAQLPASPSSARVALWRRLRAAGATSVLNGAWVLPRTDEHAALVALLAETVRGQGGSVTLFATQAASAAEQDAIVARFRADRGREYGELAERCDGFLAEIVRETDLQKFTFAELEELEDDLDKLTTWLRKIRARDFFPDQQAQAAADALERCDGALRAFAEEVYAFEGVAAPREGEAGPPKAST